MPPTTHPKKHPTIPPISGTYSTPMNPNPTKQKARGSRSIAHTTKQTAPVGKPMINPIMQPNRMRCTVDRNVGSTASCMSMCRERSRGWVTLRPPNGLAFSCRERAAQASLKKGAILRAKRSTATPCWTAARSCRALGRFCKELRRKSSEIMR